MGQIYKFCKVQGKVVPIEDVLEEMEAARTSTQLMFDEMPATRHPIDGKYYTSKKEFRRITKAHGYEEVGNDYDHGYEPERANDEAFKKLNTKIRQEFRERYGK